MQQRWVSTHRFAIGSKCRITSNFLTTVPIGTEVVLLRKGSWSSYNKIMHTEDFHASYTVSLPDGTEYSLDDEELSASPE